MSDAFTQFEKRLASLERKHSELAKGYVAKINPDGLVTVHPARKSGGLKLRLLVALAAGLILFKSVTLAVVGVAIYEGRILALAEGTWFERVCAWVMQIDPVSRAVAGVLNQTVLQGL